MENQAHATACCPHSTRLDDAAIVGSTLCLAHCIALPAIMMLLPALDHEEAAHASFHLGALFVLVPLGLMALWQAQRRHGQRWVMGLGGLGLAMIAAAATHPALHEWEWGITVVGSSILITVHGVNRRL